MTLTPVTAPAAEPVTLAEAKAHLRVDHTGEDALIGALIGAARRHLDGRDGWLGRALVTQTWDLWLDAFPDRVVNAIRVPLPPLQAVVAVTYVDLDGATQTMPGSDYQVTAAGHIVPAHGKTWPATRDQPDAVKVRFRAGYGDVGSDVPEPIRAAMLLMIGHLYANREAVVVGSITAELPMAVDALLTPYRVWGM